MVFLSNKFFWYGYILFLWEFLKLIIGLSGKRIGIWLFYCEGCNIYGINILYVFVKVYIGSIFFIFN